jgi:hypothetical protein
MELGGLAGMTALTMGLGQDRAVKAKEIAAQDTNGAGKLISA